MEVRRIAGALGAEISGVDLRSLEDDAVKENTSGAAGQPGRILPRSGP
jgi:hypothetical protein